MKINIEISARHCHISRTDLDILFGKGYQLKPIKPLSQKGQFATADSVAVKTAGGRIEGIRILGPERKNTQVELSLTDTYKLRIKAPIIECTHPEMKKCGCSIAEIIGPKGKVKRCCVIVAHRHFHCDPITAGKLNLKDKQLVSLKTFGKRGVIFNNVLVRIDESFVPNIHLDTDEGNAAGISTGSKGELLINK